MRLSVVPSDAPPSAREPLMYSSCAPFGVVLVKADDGPQALPFFCMPLSLPSRNSLPAATLPSGVSGIATISSAALASFGGAEMPAQITVSAMTDTSVPPAESVELVPLGPQNVRSLTAALQLSHQLHGRVVATKSILCSPFGDTYQIRAVQPPAPIVCMQKTTKIALVASEQQQQRKSLSASPINWQHSLSLPLPATVLSALQKPLRAFLETQQESLLLFYGSPGTGKTSAALALADALHVPRVFVPVAPLLRSTEEETRTEIMNCFERACKCAPSVLVLDDLDSLCRPRAQLRDALERYAVTALLRALDHARPSGTEQGAVLIIGTALDPTCMDSEVLSRFTSIHFTLPSPPERTVILRALCRKLSVSDALLAEVAADTHGFVGADLGALIRYASIEALRHERLPALTAADFAAARRILQPSLLAQHTAAFAQARSLNDIVGLDQAISALRVTVVMPFRESERLRALGIARTSGVLLHGPPGCGKTMLSRAAAGDACVNVIEVQGADVLTKLVGESEKSIARLFARARQVAPSILLFDQFEFLGRARGASEATSQTAERLVSCLLAELDTIQRTQAQVLVIATASSREALDPALLQPGRFEQHILISLPSTAQRLAILRQRLRSLPLDAALLNNDAWQQRLAEQTAGFSSAALQLLCEEAALSALREDVRCAYVQERHFEQALQTKKQRR